MNEPSIRMFVDENGHHYLRGNLADNSNRFLCLTGVVMRLHTHIKLEQQLNKLKTRYFDSKDVILHRREIIPGKKPFEALKDENVRDCFNSDLLRIISDLKGIEHFVSLTVLSFFGNQLTEVDLSNNTALEYISLYSNDIAEQVMIRLTTTMT